MNDLAMTELGIQMPNSLKFYIPANQVTCFFLKNAEIIRMRSICRNVQKTPCF